MSDKNGENQIEDCAITIYCPRCKAIVKQETTALYRTKIFLCKCGYFEAYARGALKTLLEVKNGRCFD